MTVEASHRNAEEEDDEGPAHPAGPFSIPAPLPHAARHNPGMALRFTVQGDDEQETAAGLELLLDAGLQLAMPPRELTDARWMARAVPGKAEAPADEGRGSGVSG